MDGEHTQSTIDFNSSVPLYKQVKSELALWIQGSENGASLPTEKELCLQFGVSRQTIRQAILELVEEGLVTRRAGQGTFVRKQKISRDTRWALEDFNREMRYHGLEPETFVLSLTQEQSHNFVSRQLNIPNKALVWVIRRLRFVDGWPVVIQQSYLPAHLFPDFQTKDEDLKERSLHTIIESDYQYFLQNAERTIEAIPVASREAELLKIAPGSPVLYSTSLWAATGDIKVEYVLEWYRGDRSQFKIQLGRQSDYSDPTIG
ncbi:MAG: GntR family transcriptional regulator [Sphaerochaeta sp.]|jgi:GntR family transcriptional regulator|nr:GntR family transcriptional regulator [Sphaerochaeta sp.]